MTSSARSSRSLRTFAFGAPDEETWVVGWCAGPGEAGVLVAGDGDGVQAHEVRLAAGDADTWQVSADGVELVITPTSPPATLSGVEGPIDGYEQAASVSGTVAGHPVAASGRRGTRPDGGELARADSVREMATWFDDGEVIAVSAVRPRKPKGHDQDAVHAAVLAPDTAMTIVEPRLSTTYTAAGRARRVGLELWDADEEAPPVRVTADGRGRGGSVSAGGWDLTVDWLAGHRRGRDGAGVFVLARPG